MFWAMETRDKIFARINFSPRLVGMGFFPHTTDIFFKELPPPYGYRGLGK